jgi:thioredoxin reductase
MSQGEPKADFDVAIVGGGPAGLSAAVVLGRSRRRVIMFDHSKPRNFAATAVHCYLGLDGIAPGALREKGRNEAEFYGAQIVNAEVVAARRLPGHSERLNGFVLDTKDRSFTARALLLCTGVVDVLPDIANIYEYYGRSVHHCPYCDGWEHRDQRLVALGNNSPPVELALSLRTWSSQVIACSNGHALEPNYRRLLAQNGIDSREEKIARLHGQDGKLSAVLFESGPPLPCDALFFSSDQAQSSPLPAMLGCKFDDDHLAQTKEHQDTRIPGLFVAGDADGEVQFAIVAAAEGAIAATAINKALQEDDQKAQN